MLEQFKPNTPFCILKRKSDEQALILTGQLLQLSKLADIPRQPFTTHKESMFHSVSMIPFSQIRERGYEARYEGEDILCLKIDRHEFIDVDRLAKQLPQKKIQLQGKIKFNYSRKAYAQLIKKVIQEEIGNGEGANFVIPRKGTTKIKGMSMEIALSIYRSILINEYGSYWNFLFFDGEKYFIGASPERHVSVTDSLVEMNPISGTFRKTPLHRDLAKFKKEFLRFLIDEKEINELFMVVDEELKMMTRICEEGGTVVGPLLKEMSKLIHTEYLLSGKSAKDVIDVFRDSMHAATVTGSPLENACKIICKYESESRRYYAGGICLIGQDVSGREFLDSAITIRTLEISGKGDVLMRVGGTLVRNSIPDDEVKETESKMSAMLASLSPSKKIVAYPQLKSLKRNSEIQKVLDSRNQYLSHFWMEKQNLGSQEIKVLQDKKITLIDNEDEFVFMMQHMLQHMGACVDVVRFSDYDQRESSDFMIVGPGPGNPNDVKSLKIKKNEQIIKDLIYSKKKFMAVCLGHQIFCRILGIEVSKKKFPFQGTQEEINLFGKKEKVGFYNTFAGKFEKDLPGVEIAYDSVNREIFALRGNSFVSFQFHVESILTQNGYDILRDTTKGLLA